MRIASGGLLHLFDLATGRDELAAKLRGQILDDFTEHIGDEILVAWFAYILVLCIHNS